MAPRKLGVVKTIVESAGMDIGHVWDDLVFLNHTGLILQFTDREDIMLIHRNSEGELSVLDRAISLLKETALLYAMTFLDGEDFLLSQEDDENLRLEFLEPG